nr:MAG: coat protein [Wufeng shrew permutotetravirus 14]
MGAHVEAREASLIAESVPDSEALAARGIYAFNAFYLHCAFCGDTVERDHKCESEASAWKYLQLLTSGDVEENPGPTRNVNVTGRNVVVKGPSANNPPPLPPRQKRRNRRRATPQPISSEAIELAGGVLASDPRTGLRSRLETRVNLEQDHISWLFKYLDPAGATESARAVGEYSKVPDGLVKFSVDAEIRVVNNEECPTNEASSIPLDGSLWSMSVISFPLFRCAYILVANTEDKEMTETEIGDLCATLNSISNWRQKVDNPVWRNFTNDETFFYRIRALPPTYDLPDPTEGTLRTVTDWRMTYKSLTVEANMPSLIDQGYWIGGHFSLTPNVTEQTRSDTFGSQVTLTVERYNQTPTFGVSFTFTGLPWGGIVEPPTAPAPIWVQPPQTQTPWLSWFHGGTSTTQTVSYVVPAGYELRIANSDAIWAESGDTITFSQTITGTLRVNSSNTTATELSLPVDSVPTTQSFTNFFEGEQNSTNRLNVSLPPMTLSQVAANNPKMEQFLEKDTMGAYLVHSKMRSPVFNLTPASAFGALQLTYPGYTTSRNPDDARGIFDSFDANMSTAVTHFRGMSHAQTLVIKVYQGWEGVTAVNTPFGQFAHSGMTKCPEVLDLADNLATELTGVYPATDNFAATVSALAASALSGLLKSEATQSMVAHVANTAVETAKSSVARVPRLLSSGVKTLFTKISARRNARRAQRAASLRMR